MGKNNIERNKLDYLLTDIMPVEISELFSYREFYDFLTEEKEELKIIKDELLKIKSKGKEKLFNGGWWASTPLKYNILKGVSGTRELNLVQPISALNILQALIRISSSFKEKAFISDISKKLRRDIITCFG